MKWMGGPCFAGLMCGRGRPQPQCGRAWYESGAWMLKVQISFAPKGRTFREGFGEGLGTSQGRGCSSGRKPPLLRGGRVGRVVELTVLRRSFVRTRTSTTPVWMGSGSVSI